MISKPVDWEGVVDMKSMSRLNLISFPPSPSFSHYGIFFTMLDYDRERAVSSRVKSKKVRGLAAFETLSQRATKIWAKMSSWNHILTGHDYDYVSTRRHCP